VVMKYVEETGRLKEPEPSDGRTLSYPGVAHRLDDSLQGFSKRTYC
jgi:hypothetical protein